MTCRCCQIIEALAAAAVAAAVGIATATAAAAAAAASSFVFCTRYVLVCVLYQVRCLSVFCVVCFRSLFVRTSNYLFIYPPADG